MTIEKTILCNLIFNEDFVRKTLPFIKTEYFRDSSERATFTTIKEYIDKYNLPPSKEALKIDLANRTDLNETQFKECNEIIGELKKDAQASIKWLVEHAEKFCQDQALFIAVSKSIQLINDEKGSISKGSIPQLLSEALAVSFDTSIGHDLIEDWEKRFALYQTKENKVPFNLEYFNKITKDGISNKTLSICLAGCVHPSTKIRVRLRMGSD